MHTNDSPGINRDDIDGRTVGTLVVGAGQAGLVMGRRLQLAGEDVLLVEADARVGDTWRRHYDSLKLFSLPKYSSLPGHRIPCTTFPTRDEMADYLEDYARRFDLPVHTSTRVLTIERQGVSFAVRTNRGTLTAGRVVVASGAHRRPIVPAVAAHLAPGITQLHSLEYRGPHQFAPGGVLVVGAANSGTDVALEAARSGHPTWLAGRHPGQIPVDIDTRRAQLVVPVIMFMFRHVLTLRTPMGRKAHQQSIGHGVNLVRNKLADIEDAGIVCVGRIEAEQDGRRIGARCIDRRVVHRFGAGPFVPASGRVRRTGPSAARTGCVDDSRAVLPGSGIPVRAGLRNDPGSRARCAPPHEAHARRDSRAR
jgi:putative flavoprotein involved in K+ transport